MSINRMRRYVAWLDRHVRAVLAIAALAVAAAGYLIATRLPIRADFSYLLPDDAPSLRDLHRLEARMPAKDTTLVLLVAPDARTRREAGAILVAGLRELGPELVDRLEVDDAATRELVRKHRFLYPALADLVAARDALTERIAQAKLHANPLYIDVETPAANTDELDRLRRERRAAEDKLDRSSYVSADEGTQLAVLRTAFRATDVPRDRELRASLDAVFDRVRAAYPAVELGLAGGVPTAIAEHDAIAHGMVLSSLITSLLVALVLAVQLRRLVLIVLVGAQIVIATVISFGLAAVTVGHLNAATAFLGAIIAGNGINYGILLVARYGEERRSQPVADAVAAAIASTLRPTLVASLGASIAYGALVVTRFKGFSDFAIIGGIGMLVCWVVAYTVLPALLLRVSGAVPAHAPIFGRIVERVFAPRRRVLAIVGAVTLAAGIVAVRYVAADPFEYDMSKIRSDAPAALEARRWLAVSNAAFGRGVVGRTYFAVERPEDVPVLVAALREARARTEDGKATIGQIQSILDVVPADQDRKLAVLAELRRLLDDRALDELDDATRTELHEVRPPDDLRPVTTAELPPELVEQFREIDGRVGLIVVVRPAGAFDESDGHTMIRFAAAIRRLHLGIDFTVSGSSLVFADILEINRADGLVVTACAALGLVVMVIFVIGRNRRAVAVLAATVTGSVVMIGICALVGLKVNFLDFVALPIALGLGVDYAVNIAERVAGDEVRVALRTTGGAVLVCSLTTMIGYASLLVSDNHAIRDFGLASLIGEITCVVTALTLVPAIVARSRT